jgi:hypothetical protein
MATRAISGGECILKDSALAIAFDVPFRCTHCAFCAMTSTTISCPSCGVISSCDSCRDKHTVTECQLMQAFDSNVDTSVLLMLRILLQRYGDGDPREQDWKLFDELYASPVDLPDIVLEVITFLASTFPWVSTTKAQPIYQRIQGCAHAITDMSRPLGVQTLGRAIYCGQSFYNHACVPNAYLSCRGGVEARVYAVRPIEKGEVVTLSYIPMSGMDRSERRQLLSSSYHFTCQCDACLNHDDWEILLKVPPGSDLASLREIQYGCNATILQQDCDDDDLNHAMSMIKMTQRGIANQGIPASHEVSIEAHRLLAEICMLLDKNDEAVVHHKAFLLATTKIADLFDPVANGTQLLEMAETMQNEIEANTCFEGALALLQRTLGRDHPWLATVMAKKRRESGLSKTAAPRMEAKGSSVIARK